MKPIAKASGEAYHLSSPWTVERIEEVRRLAKEGFPASKIAQRFRVSRNAVIGLCHRRGIKLGARPAPKMDKAKENRWTVDDIKRLIALREAGKPTLEIAASLGRSERSIVSKLGQMGFPSATKQCPSRKAASRSAAPKTVIAKSVERSVVTRLEKAPPAPWNGKPVALLDAGLNCCRWPAQGPHASPGGWYCGAPVVRRSWCSHHLALGTTRPATKAERAAAAATFKRKPKMVDLAGGRILDEEAA